MPEFEFANLAVAIIVPFVSVWAAQQLVRRDAKRQAATDAFIQLHRHAQEHIYAYMTLRNTDEFRYQATKDNKALPEDFARVRHEQSERVLATIANLETDCLVLGLVFGGAADALGRKVRDFAHRADILLEGKYARPPHADDRLVLQSSMNEIAAEMKCLWETNVARRFG